MFKIFTLLADWLTYSVFNLMPNTKLGLGVHFFIEDCSKILFLLAVLIYLISFIRAGLDATKVRTYLHQKNASIGYLLSAVFGAITPFCSCSSVPIFMGFVAAQMPIGFSVAFLVTSPLVNEIVVIMLGGTLGLKFTLIYIAIGITLGAGAGLLTDKLKAHRWLQPFLAKMYTKQAQAAPNLENVASEPLDFNARHLFAKDEMLTIFKRIWLWVLVGVGVGAFIHGYIPSDFFKQYLSNNELWSVPLASSLAIPMYTNASGIVPIMVSLINKGMPIGTTLAFCMSAVAISLPEFIMLKQVMQYKLLILIVLYLFTSITIVGWLFNYLY